MFYFLPLKSASVPKENSPLRLESLQLLPTRVKLLLADGHSCYRPRRSGERKRKSVRGSIVAQDLSVLALSIVKQGEGDIPGLTDVVNPKRLGPKRATKIRRFFGLSKQDDVRYGKRFPPTTTYMLTIDTASLSFDVKSSPRRKARNPTQRPPRSRDLSPHNAYNTRDTELLSSEDVPKPPRMPPMSTLSCWPSACTRSVRREPSSERDVLLPSESRLIWSAWRTCSLERPGEKDQSTLCGSEATGAWAQSHVHRRSAYSAAKT